MGARAANAKKQIKTYHAGLIFDKRNDRQLLSKLYRFIEEYKPSSNCFYSFVALFDRKGIENERDFERGLWAKLQSLHEADSHTYDWDSSVSRDPHSEDFSFSLGGEAFFIIGLNPHSRRKSRQYCRPALVFNMHRQFERLREQDKFEHLRDAIRTKDTQFCGSENAMLQDHGASSEALQYSGRKLSTSWQCPFNAGSTNVQHD
jgi:hypothetical protein